MQGRGIEATAFQGFADRVDVPFAVAENQGVLDRLRAQQGLQNPVLVAGSDHCHGLIHSFRGRGGRGDGYFRRVVKKNISQAANFGRHGGREKQRLPLRIAQLHDAFHIRDEAHVQHPVGLIDYQYIDAAQQQPAAFEMVQQSAGRRN